ncbi:MAG: glycosyltransferase [Anaeromyxobacteraceae bacterium]
MATTARDTRGDGDADLLMVIPVRNEGERLERFLADLSGCPAAPVTSFVVVDDGSTSSMVAHHERAVAALSARLRERGSPHHARLLVSPANEGKGAAIRRGWGDGGSARWLGFVDGDGAVPAREFWRLAAALGPDASFDALLGSRVAAQGRRVLRKPLRAIQGAVFARIANAVLGIDVADPQCGLKFFRALHLTPMLARLKERGWSLDPELLLLFRKAGCRLREEPIDWTEHASSKVVFGVDAVRMFVELLRIRRRIARG